MKKRIAVVRIADEINTKVVEINLGSITIEQFVNITSGMDTQVDIIEYKWREE